MESTGVYWRSVYDVLETHGIEAYVVNARHIKQVPGRKTDVLDSEWLAELGRCGLLRNSFIPPMDLRQVRMLTRYRQRLVGIIASEKNRLHKVLDEAGIRLGCVATDIDGLSAREMIAALIEGQQTPEELAQLARGRMRPKLQQLKQALVGELSDRHRFLLAELQQHIQSLQSQCHKMDEQIVAAMKPYQVQWQLLQTMPGVDEMSAAMLLAEIGVDMSRFGSKARLSSWAGVCPGNHESAGKRKYILLKNQQPYVDPKIDYEAMSVARNAPRWIKALKRYGYWPQSNPNAA